MKKFIICLIFLISFANAIQCYNGKNYVDIPESKLSDLGYTKYNITHSKFYCKIAYKRYLKVKEIEPVNVSYVTKSEKEKLEEPSKISSLLPICLLVIIVCIIWLIKIAIQKEPQDDYYTVIQKEPIKSKNDNIKTESNESWDDLSREYSEKLKKIEQERVKNGFYEISKPNPTNNSLDKIKTTYDLLLERPEWKAYRLKVLAERGKKCEWCGSNKILQVHHKFYLKYPDGRHVLPWKYNINALLVLCKDCHTKAHKKYKIKTYYTSY